MRKNTGGLSIAQYAAIGRVACEWAHMEALLGYYVRAVTGWDERTCDKVIASLRSIDLFELVVRLLHSDGKAEDEQSELYCRFSAMRGDFDRLRVERNRIVHRDWLCDRPGRAIAFELQKKGKDKLIVRRNVAQIDAIAGEITHFADALWMHMRDCLPPPWGRGAPAK